MTDPTITAITAEIDNAFSSEKATEIGILTIKSANQTVEDAAHRPDPRQLYRELWYEGEVCCLFADSNLGKSIFAVQMADEIARTAKRDLSSPITQNHLAGSKKLYNFFDSVFAIGMSAKDNRLRYVKQVKVRAGAFRYDASNVLVYEVEKTDGFLHFNFLEFATEEEHLRHRKGDEVSETESQVLALSEQGLSCRKIAEQIKLSKSTVNNILNKHRQSLSNVQDTIRESGQMDNGQPQDNNLFEDLPDE